MKVKIITTVPKTQMFSELKEGQAFVTSYANLEREFDFMYVKVNSTQYVELSSNKMINPFSPRDFPVRAVKITKIEAELI